MPEDTTLIVAEDYRGRALEVRHHPEVISYQRDKDPVTGEYTVISDRIGSRRHACYLAYIDGRNYQGLWTPEADGEGPAKVKLLKKCRATVDRWEADAAIKAEAVELIRLVDTGRLVQVPHLAGATYQVGEYVTLHAQGKVRPGIVTKVGRKNCEVAWTTPSSDGAIYRKPVAFHLLRPLVRP